MPGRHLTDHHVRHYMNLRTKDQPSVAAAKAGDQHRHRLPHRIRSAAAVPETDRPHSPAARQLHGASVALLSRCDFIRDSSDEIM